MPGFGGRHVTRILKPGASLLLAMMVTGCHREPPISPQGLAASVEPAFKPYSEPVSGLPAGGLCSLDAINGQSAADRHIRALGWTSFAGWMADPSDAVPEGALFVLASATSAYAVPVAGGGARSDVAIALAKPGLANAGFNLKAWLPGVPGGTYRAAVVYPGQATKACDLGVVVTIGP